MMLPRGSAKQNPVPVPAITVEWAEAAAVLGQRPTATAPHSGGASPPISSNVWTEQRSSVQPWMPPR